MERKRNPPDKRVSTGAVEAARIDTVGIDGHGRQQSRLRDTRSREIPQEESGDRSCGLINTYCVRRNSKIERTAGGRCWVGSKVHLSWPWLREDAAPAGAGPVWSSLLVHLWPPLVPWSPTWVPEGADPPRVLVTSSGPMGMSRPPVGISGATGCLQRGLTTSPGHGTGSVLQLGVSG